MSRNSSKSRGRRSRRLEIERLEDRLAPSLTRVTMSPATDFFPTWDPRGETIAFITDRSPGGGAVRNIGLTQASGANEYLAARGPSIDFGIGASPSWVGSTGLLMINERVFFHEYMTFNTALAPYPTTFVRTATDGNDAAFTVKLSIDGGGGGENIVVSRDGSTALWRFSDNGGGGNMSIRTAPYASLAGQSARTFGTLLQTTFNATQQFYVDSQGFALSPNGAQYVIAEPIAFGSGFGFDLFLKSTVNGAVIRRLTTTGQSIGAVNVQPDFSADGSKIAFASNAQNVSAPLDLAVINVDGTGLHNVTNTPTVSEQMPSWSPEGRRLAFASPNTNELGITTPGEVNNWNVYVMDVNARPTANPGGPYTAPEGGSINLNGAGSSDPDSVISSYQWDLNYDGVTFDVDATGVTPTFSAALINGPASRTIALRVADDVGPSAIVTTTVNITNVLPTGSPNSATVTVNEGQLASNTGAFSDPADPVSLSASVGTVIDSGNGTWSWSFQTSNGPNDSQTVTIFGNDGAGAVPIATFNLVVNNVAPTGSADNATVTVNEGQTASNTGTYSDPADPVSLSASVGTVIDTGGGTWSWSFQTSNGPEDSQTVMIFGNDGAGTVLIATFNLVVSNVAPSGSADNTTVSVNEGQTASNTGTFSDPTDPVSLSASAGTVIESGGGTWSWSFPTANGPNDSQTVTIFGNDGAGAVPIATFNLVVNNVAPTGTATNATVTVTAGATATNTGTYSDPADPVSLAASVGIVIDTGGGAWSWSMPTTGAPGESQTVTIFGNDGSGAVAIASFSLVVNSTQPSVTLLVSPTQINLTSTALFTVTIPSTPGFAATSLNLATLRINGSAPVRAAFADVDHDGDLDLVMQFRRSDFIDDYAARLIADIKNGPPVSIHQLVRLNFTAKTTSGSDVSGTVTVDMYISGWKLLLVLQTLAHQNLALNSILSSLRRPIW